jgi:hypothetical protein
MHSQLLYVRNGVKSGKTPTEQMFSALLPTADILHSTAPCRRLRALGQINLAPDG